MARGVISGKVLRIALVWLLVVVLFGISPAIANAEVLLPNSGSISGVVENESGDPIQGAWVYAYGESGKGVYTGADGSYSITGLAAGGYVLSAEASGYASEYYDNVYDWSSATPVLVADLTDRPNTDFTLGPGGSISGVVENESGDPIEWAWVCADGNSFGYDYTEADGSYTIADLAPGSYMVWAEADGYASQYYDAVYDQNLTTLVSVTPQNDAPNINFALALGGSISGVVENESGDPIEGARVYVNENPWGGDYSGADGSYSITGLAAGGYVVGVEAPDYAGEYYNNAFDWCSATLVTVTVLNDTSNIDFALGPGGVDATPPTTPVVTDDGAATVSTSELHATWSSSDPESCIAEYQYAIGTTAGGIDMVAWTSAGTNTQVTKTGLVLTVGTTYYFSVKAKNGRNLWSGVGVSDGTQVVETSTPPAANTNDASNVATTSARLNGNLTSLGTASSVTVSFVWGTTLGGPYPNETTGQAMTSTGAFYFDQGSLIPGATYYYRARAVGDGTSYGAEEKSFTTLTTPPSVTTNDATEIGDASATLNGSLTSLGTASSVQVSFQWGLTASYGNTTAPQTVTGTGSFSANISPLTDGTTYYYRAKAVGHGDPVYGSGMNLTTGPSPSVVTYAAGDVTTSSARLNGNLTSLGTAENVTVSFVWGTTLGGPYPNETTSENMTSTGTFYFDEGGLDPTTIYYYRAKAVGNGTSHGMEMSFNTFPPSPLVTTGDASSITANSARLNGDLTWLGTASSVQVSFQWGASSGSYAFETTSENMTSTGAFHFDLPGLIPGATYYYRARAVDDGTVYGVEKSFTTATTPPGVTTDDASDVTTSSARIQGNLTGLGTASSVQVSFEWWETGKPVNTTTPQTMTDTGAFSASISGLTVSTTYYYRAKAVGQGDPVYGSDRYFNTLTPPAVTTNAAGDVTTSSARLNGNLSSLGTADNVTVSFVSGTTLGGPYPNETTSENMTSTGLFSAGLPGLSPGTTYYYQAKAVGDGTSYGVERSFTTSTPPSVATNTAIQVTADSARINGELTSLGTASSVTVSFSWGTSPGSYANETAGVAKTAAGTFYFDLSGLSPNTTYYYQAKAAGAATAYGVERTLTTGQTPEIEAVDPSSGKQGQHLTITILGSNFDGATGVSFGSGITMEDFDVNSTSTITARIAIDKGAEVGARDVSVATIDGIGTKAGGFTVTQRGDGLPSWIWITVGVAAVLGALVTYLVGKRRPAKP